MLNLAHKVPPNSARQTSLELLLHCCISLHLYTMILLSTMFHHLLAQESSNLGTHLQDPGEGAASSSRLLDTIQSYTSAKYLSLELVLLLGFYLCSTSTYPGI